MLFSRVVSNSEYIISNIFIDDHVYALVSHKNIMQQCMKIIINN